MGIPQTVAEDAVPQLNFLDAVEKISKPAEHTESAIGSQKHEGGLVQVSHDGAAHPSGELPLEAQVTVPVRTFVESPAILSKPDNLKQKLDSLLQSGRDSE